MKRMIKAFSAAALSALLTALCVIPAFAAVSVKTGDTVVISVSVENESTMGSTTIQIDYDSTQLDFLSDEKRTEIATGATNSKTAGQVLWVAVFDPEGADYTNKTEVYRCLLVAKQDIASVEELISFKVNDAYRIGAEGIEKAEPSNLTCSIFAEGSEPQQNTSSQEITDNTSSQTVSETPTQSTVNDGRTTAPSKPSVTSSALNNSSKATISSITNNTSSKAKDSDKAVSSESSKNSEDSDIGSKINKKDTDTSDSTDVLEEADGLAQGFTEKDFESVPPIKTETEDTVSKDTSSKGKFPVWAIIGTVVGIVMAIAGIIIKKRG